MKYQLVLQFDASATDDFNRFVVLEGVFVKELGNVATVDGHDFGLGEFNIFVLTDKPREAFSAVQRIADQHGAVDAMRAAYRELAADDFVILWPPWLTEFTVA
jgi:hypothetical protein